MAFASPAAFTFLSNREQAVSTLNHFRNIGLIRDRGYPPSIDEWLEGFNTVSPIRWIDKISPRPLLLIHGDKDDVVPVTDVYQLYERAKQPKEMVVISGAGHRLRLVEEAVTAASNWLTEKSR